VTLLYKRFSCVGWAGLLISICAGCGGGGTSVSASPAPATCSVDNWCWRNPLPQGNRLMGVWGSGASDVWAVGDSGTILHWNGSAWSSATSGTANTLTGVWGSASNAWAVGRSGTILQHAP
jgi:hypothetical protein